MQPVILEGRALQKLTTGVSALSVTTLDDHRIVRFSNSARLRPISNNPHFLNLNNLPCLSRQVAGAMPANTAALDVEEA